jgi:hypothetical protein
MFFYKILLFFDHDSQPDHQKRTTHSKCGRAGSRRGCPVPGNVLEARRTMGLKIAAKPHSILGSISSINTI